MKKILLTLVLGLGLLTANAQQTTQTPNTIEKLAGPRIGFTYIGAGPTADFLHKGFDFDEDNTQYGSTGPGYTTQYGWQWESRFADGGGEIVGIVEWIVLVAGMEQGKFLPSATSIIGLRTDEGLEFGTGPNLSLAGVGMVFGIGYNFKSGNLNLPVNIAFMPGRKKDGTVFTPNGETSYEYDTGARISIMVGFNMSK